MFSVTKAFSYIIYIYHILSLQPGSSPAVNFIQKKQNVCKSNILLFISYQKSLRQISPVLYS